MKYDSNLITKKTTQMFNFYKHISQLPKMILDTECILVWEQKKLTYRKVF